jgi:hypothetical protein
MLAYGTLSTTSSDPFHRGTLNLITSVKTIKLFNESTEDVIVSIEYTNGITTRLYDRYLFLSGDALEISPSYPIEYSGTAQGLNIWADTANSVNCFLQGVERAI